MRALAQSLLDRWASGRHIGPSRPHQVVKIRRGHFVHGFGAWAGPLVDAEIPKEKDENPWQGTWVATTDWTELPSVAQVTLDQDFSQKGRITANIALENIIYRPHEAMGYLVHLSERGALSPYRGFVPHGRPSLGVQSNEWKEVLVKNAQILVLQGYGEDLVPTFTGLIDDVQPESGPDRIQLVVRDFGQALDQNVWGKVIGNHIAEPVIFSPPKKKKKGGDADEVKVAYAGTSTGATKGHGARFVADDNPKTMWISDDKSSADNTEWVQVKLPRGKYHRIILRPGYKGMTAFISIKATDNGLGGERPELDGAAINEGWVKISEEEGGGIVPGAIDGEFPYMKRIKNLSEDYHVIDLKHVLHIGHESILRVSFRNLHRVSEGKYRAACATLRAFRNPFQPKIYQRVGRDTLASSHLNADHTSKQVVDKHLRTRWITENKSSADNTEWVQIRVPQGTYGSFMLLPWYPHMNMFVGIFARPRHRRNLLGSKYAMPCEVDNQPLQKFNPATGLWEVTTDAMWIDLSHPPFNEGGTDVGTVPGSIDGDWPFVKRTNDVEVPGGYPFGSGPAYTLHSEKYYFRKPNGDHRKFELGADSVIRIGFRNLRKIDRKKKSDVYRASVGHFKAVSHRRLDGGKDKDKDKSDLTADVTKRIVVEDVSDVVRVVLRWAGFKEWIVEDTGAKLNGEWKFTRKDTLQGIIDKVSEAVGYTFFIMPPLDGDNSIGVPVFRATQVLRDDLPVQLVTDDQIVTQVQAKITDEPLSSRIIVRGDAATKKQGGKGMGAQRDRRYTAAYTPPWQKHGRLANVKRISSKDEYRLPDQQSVEVYARMIALRQALESATATFAVPGMPQLDLDDQVGLLDRGTGMNTRVYVAQLQSVFTTGEATSWFTTVGGALLDTPDVADAKAELLSFIPATRNASVGAIFTQVAGD